MGFPLSVICSGRPIELDKPHILALATETGFLLFKEQVPLKFKKEISAVQCESKTFRFISLSTPVSFCWTVPLKAKRGALRASEGNSRHFFLLLTIRLFAKNDSKHK
jgi:hypothetical protein